MMHDIFIEPTTGRTYFLDSNCPYHSIEAIFNNKNFWVNLDPSREIENLSMKFDRDQTGEWEYVMVTASKGEDDEEDEGDADSGPEDDQIEDEENLDMPPPWSPKLIVLPEKFADGTRGGQKTLFYKKCRVDFYSECKQVDGLVKRVTLYKDYKRLVVKEIRSYYACRIDKLYLRRRFPYKFKLIEHYESSALSAHWKKMVMVDGEYRKIWFYHHRNEDGLIYREEQIGSRTFERFKDREDRLVYRSVKFTTKDKDQAGANMGQTFVLSENLHLKRSVTIEKMTQKYGLAPEKDAERQIAKCEFNLKDGEVNVYYHYRDGKITCNKTSYSTEELLDHNKGDGNEKEVETDKSQNYREIYER